MRRGTTPTFCCRLPAACRNFSDIEAYFAQSGNVVLKLTKDDMVLNGNDISFTLSDSQTSAFKLGETAELQIRLVTSEGKILVSDIRKITVRINLSHYM